MQIPQNLPQFTEKKTLLLVTSLHDVIAYEAYNGNCTEIQRAQVEKDQYTDNEGHFERSGDGKTFGSGSVKEEHTKNNRKKIQQLITAATKSLDLQTYIQIILFCPEHLKNINTEPFEQFSEKLTVIQGNYSKKNIPELLELL